MRYLGALAADETNPTRKGVHMSMTRALARPYRVGSVPAIFPAMSPDPLPLERSSRKTYALLALVGWVLIFIWACWWAISARQNHLFASNLTRIPAWKHLGLDFKHNYWAVRLWVKGGNPYLEDFGDSRGKYSYPPIVLPLFVWSAPLRTGYAVVAWMGIVSLILAAGAAMTVRLRRAWRLTPLPWSFITAMLLLSMPVMFATERGQADAVVVAAILVAGLAVARYGEGQLPWRWDIAIGLCMAVAIWTKIYPAVLLAGLIVPGLYRAFGIATLTTLVTGLVPWQWTKAALTSPGQSDRIGFVTEVRNWLFDPNYAPAQLTDYPTISLDAHSLTTYWSTFWNQLGVWRLGRVPGIIGAGVVLAPLVLWVSWRVFRSPMRARMAMPYLLWLTAAATFGLPVSYDYNLIYLPLAAFAVWDRRDGLAGAILIVATAAWAQPFILLPFPHVIDVLFFLKLLSLIAMGACIVRRATRTQLIESRAEDRETASDVSRSARTAAVV
jgi:hypothetical protein